MKQRADWEKDLLVQINSIPTACRPHAEANAEAVTRACAGFGPDASYPDTGSGLRFVAALSSAHVSAFCNSRYLNGYDLGNFRLGGDPATGMMKLRELVDSSLPVTEPDKVYFGAAALSGPGIRFYGDICLVLKPGAIAPDSIVLDRNSYDLIRPPFSRTLNFNLAKMKNFARDHLAGKWEYVGTIAALKAVFSFVPRNRRLTTGQIASAILDDEDYIEVLKKESFTADDLECARTSSQEAALADHIAGKSTRGPAPTLAELHYLSQRQEAMQALARARVRLDVVTTEGRTR